MENEEVIEQEEVLIPEEDDTDELLEKYETEKKYRADDSASMQAVMCILLIAVLFGINIVYPETAGELLNRIKEFSASSTELFVNPIDWVIEYCSALN